ncbi:hypothetical protein K6119_13565 [Paracrocinitomix mangrovi]|uniref:hypothetical protein n=1 Tax=Paracrocinitomix mangrovi TaxID=2862509 RepID=UPI001C8ED123|nr:hypothetical protein [Paracrocinitomix mangrovi]UKN00759.1 hypothetical protein K6119_13565 [Paracrocinitomix mangrovi]
MKKFIIPFSMFILLSCGGEEVKNEGSEEEEISEETISEEEVFADDIADSYVPDDQMDGGQKCDDRPIEVYLNDPDKGGTNVRDTPNGKVVGQLKEDDINVAFFITVYEASNGWFRVNNIIEGMEEDFMFNDNGECWIHGSVLSVDTRNYEGETIEVMGGPTYGIQQPDHFIDKEMSGFHLLDKCGPWLKVKGNGIEGWIHSEWLCGNPLTTCS